MPLVFRIGPDYILKTIFENNGYPKSFVDICIEKYLDKVFVKKEVVLKVLKSNLFASFYWIKVIATENLFSSLYRKQFEVSKT